MVVINRHFLELITVQWEERKEKAETIKRIVKHVLMWQPIPEFVIAMHVLRNIGYVGHP